MARRSPRARVGQASGEVYQGIEQPDEAMAKEYAKGTAGPAFRGLQDFPALKQQSDAVYDIADQDIRNNGMGFNTTIDLMNNQQAKVSPWASLFQAMANRGVNKVGQDAARPHGLADDPNWHMQGDVGALAQLPIGAGKPGVPGNPLMQSNNIATPAMMALKRYRD